MLIPFRKFVAWATSPTGVAVNALGVTQIVSWGTTLYALAVLAGPIGQDTGWSPSIVFGGLSIGLLVSGAISTHTGRLIDTRGARSLMSIGSILNAAGLLALAASTSEWIYLASWAFLGISMRLTLYDAAFAALVQVTPANGRRAISFLTLWGGFASTVFWPIGHMLNDAVGWRETCVIFAILNIVVGLPLHWWGLARHEDGPGAKPAGAAPAKSSQEAVSGDLLTGHERLIAMILFSFATSSYAFIFGAASVHLVGLIEASGVTLAAAVAIASVKGVAQVGGRVWEIVFARNMKPINLARVPVWLMPLAFAILIALAGGVGPALFFTVCFGAANGLVTIVRGALPLALFGTEGYGHILGVLATPYLLINAAAPLVLAVVIEYGGYQLGQWVLLGTALLSLAAMEILAIWYGRRGTAKP
ncbi:MAG: MFS transporter, partial [Hyphomicrobiaceae bacterium]